MQNRFSCSLHHSDSSALAVWAARWLAQLAGPAPGAAIVDGQALPPFDQLLSGTAHHHLDEELSAAAVQEYFSWC